MGKAPGGGGTANYKSSRHTVVQLQIILESLLI
jgi:hypothetical protein